MCSTGSSSKASTRRIAAGSSPTSLIRAAVVCSMWTPRLRRYAVLRARTMDSRWARWRTPEAHISPGVPAAGSPAIVKRALAGTPAEWWVQTNPPAYADLARRHKYGATRVE